MPAATLRRSPTPNQGANANANTSGGNNPPTITLPFPIASRVSSRLSFVTNTVALGAGNAPQSPIQIPAVGYLKYIDLEVTLAGSGGTSPAFTADAPWNAIASVELRNASGNDLIVPVTGYQLYLINKYGLVDVDAPFSDPRADQQFTAVSPSAHFFLRVPCEISPADAFGAIPALASNRSYQLIFTFSPQATVTTSNPTLNLTIQGVAWFWTEPVSNTKSGVTQQTAPPYNGSLQLWQIEPQPITPGDKYIRSNNVGNVLRSIICVLRTAAGVRDDANWPAISELYLDNDPLFYLPQNQWLSWMSNAFGYGINGATKDVRGGLDTGVYVIPFHSLADGKAIANGRRSQYLPTLDASLLQLRGTSWGASASTLEILTNSVVPMSASGGSASSALYGII